MCVCVCVLQALNDVLSTDFFRFFRVDLDAECPFWNADGYCTIKDCSVDEEDEEREERLSTIDLGCVGLCYWLLGSCT